MRRLFWLVMGVTIGALLVRRLSRAAEKLTPRGIASGIGGGLAELADAIREFAADVREAMAEREHQLRVSTGLDGTLGRAPGEDPAAP
jgi:hypothetical protein